LAAVQPPDATQRATDPVVRTRSPARLPPLAVEVISIFEAAPSESPEDAAPGESGSTDSPSRHHSSAVPVGYSPETSPVPARQSRGISIDNYNPTEMQPFTDPVTNQALKNLGVALEELFFPTNRELMLYTRDDDMRDAARRYLQARVQRTQSQVRDECDRIARLPPLTVAPTSRAGGSEAATDRSSRFFALEEQRMEKIKQKNRVEAEGIILSIFQEEEIAKETEEKNIKEAQKKAEHDAAVRMKRREEHERQIKRIIELEIEERERQKEIARRKQEALEQELRFEERKAEIERNKREYHERLDEERARKNEEARRAAREFDEKRRRDWEEAHRLQLLREAEFNQRREQERKEKAERAERESLRKAERCATIRNLQKSRLEQKRQDTLDNQERHEVMYQTIMTARSDFLRNLKMQNDQREAQARESREQQYAELQERKRFNFETHDQRSSEYWRTKQTDADRVRRDSGLAGVIRMEERARISSRMAALKEAGNVERQQQYEVRIRAIEDNERMKRELQLQSQLRRNQLERQKEDIQAGVVTQSDLRQKGATRIQGLAKEMGIDLEILREKAKQIRRGKGDQARSSLPPVRPSTAG
jgi:hypothetical protein